MKTRDVAKLIASHGKDATTGNHYKDLLRRAGLSQWKVAAQLGVNPASLRLYLDGKTAFVRKPEQAVRIEQFFKSLESVLERHDRKAA